MQPYHTHLQDEAGTAALGAALAQVLEPGLAIYLHGDLGAGKTALTRALLHAAGYQGRVKSPTYTLAEPYAVKLADRMVTVIHFDLYRIEDAEELYALGFEDYFGGEGACVVEWAERGETPDGESPWSEGWLRICIEQPGPEERALHCTAHGEREQTLLAAFAQSIGGEES